LADTKNQLIDRLVANEGLSFLFLIMIIIAEGRVGEVYLTHPD
jgi:hypothetical protein